MKRNRYILLFKNIKQNGFCQFTVDFRLRKVHGKIDYIFIYINFF